MPTRGSKDPNGRALRGRRAHTTFALLSDPVRQIWGAFNNRANTANADAPEAAVNGCLYDRFKGLYTKTATKPSLVIVPARFKSGTLYSQIPSSNADFTVTRNTARRFDSAGLIASVAWGIPRLDYYTSGGVTGCPALLVEPAATNLVKYSEQFNTVTSGWSPTALQTITGNTNATLDPAGGNTADLIVGTSGNAQHYLQANTNNLPSFVSGTTYTFSVFAKATSATSGFVQFVYGSIGFSPVNPYVNFQLSGNGAVTTGTYSAASIQPFGNGWYRCSFSATATASGTASFFIQPILTSGVARLDSFVANGVDGVYLWGAQLETGSVATSYIPTTTGTGSRSADVISVSGAVSGSIGQQSGTIYCEFQFNTPTVSTAGILGVESTNNQNRVLLWHNSTNNALGVQLRANNSNVFNTSIGTLTNGQIYKIAIGYSSGNTKVYLNGNSTAVITNTSAYTMAAALSRICLGNYENSANLVTVSRIRSFALYAERLTDAEMIALTTL